MDLRGLVKLIEKRIDYAPEICRETQWIFKEINDPVLVNEICRKRQSIYNKNNILDKTEKDFEWDKYSRHFGLFYKNKDKNPILSKSARVTKKSNPHGILPSELNLESGIDNEDKDYFVTVLNNNNPDKIMEIGGFINHSDKCGFGSLYSFVWNMANFAYKNSDIWVQTQNIRHTKWYLNCSGLKYKVLAGNLKKPYNDHANREAITLAFIPKIFRPAFEEALSYQVFESQLALTYRVNEI